MEARREQLWLTVPVLVCLTLARDAAGQEGSTRLVATAPVLVSSPDSRAPEVEPVLAIDPRDPDRMLAAAIVVDAPDSSVWVGSHVDLFESDDGGASWRQTRNDMVAGADPWLTIDQTGNAYFSYLAAYEEPDRVALWYQHSPDAGRTWGEVRTLGRGHDREAMISGVVNGRPATFLSSSLTVSRSGESSFAYVYLARADPGQPLAPLTRVLPNNLQSNTFAMAITASGRLVVTLLDYANAAYQMLDTRRGWILALDEDGTTLSEPRLVAGDMAPRTSFTIAADPSRTHSPDRLYALRAALDEDGSPEVLLSRSDDLGWTWSDDRVVAGRARGAAPVGPRDLVVDSNGAIIVAWFDRRHGSDENSVYLYASASLDGGETYLPAVRVTPTTSVNGVPANGTVARRFGQGGDYFGMAALPEGGAQVLWADSRNGWYQLFTATLSIESQP